jgi:Na+/phosphate symporter
MKKELTEKEKRKKILNILGYSIILLSAGLIIEKVLENNRTLKNKNNKLEKKIFTLKGKNRSLKEDNRKLLKQNYEVCYHLGKKSITHHINIRKK